MSMCQDQDVQVQRRAVHAVLSGQPVAWSASGVSPAGSRLLKLQTTAARGCRTSQHLTRSQGVTRGMLGDAGPQSSGWVGMQTVAQLRRSLGLAAPRNPDSLYKAVARGPRKFHALKIPRKLQVGPGRCWLTAGTAQLFDLSCYSTTGFTRLGTTGSGQATGQSACCWAGHLVCSAKEQQTPCLHHCESGTGSLEQYPLPASQCEAPHHAVAHRCSSDVALLQLGMPCRAWANASTVELGRLRQPPVPGAPHSPTSLPGHAAAGSPALRQQAQAAGGRQAQEPGPAAGRGARAGRAPGGGPHLPAAGPAHPAHPAPQGCPGRAQPGAPRLASCVGAPGCMPGGADGG